MSGPTHDPELTALEDALVRLAPASGVNRDALMFRAGQASVRRRAWPIAAVASTLTAAGLAAVLLLRPPTVLERVVLVEPSPAPTAPQQDDSAADYLRLRDRLERESDDAPPPNPAAPALRRTIPLDALLGLPPDAVTDPWITSRKASFQSGDPL